MCSFVGLMVPLAHAGTVYDLAVYRICRQSGGSVEMCRKESIIHATSSNTGLPLDPVEEAVLQAIDAG